MSSDVASPGFDSRRAASEHVRKPRAPRPPRDYWFRVLDQDACYRALKARDARFDGRFFTAVKTTGIYCRPVCPATTPKRENCIFFPSAAAAQEAGFRPCLRCRPETAPDQGSWLGTSNTVSRGLSLIAQGELDADDASVDALAERLGIGGRQLRRLFQQHLGASPIAVAQTRRVLFAKQLIHETELPMSEVALAAGFGSVRRFNETFQELYGRPPSSLRRKAVAPGAEKRARERGVTVRLRYRPPYDFASMLAFFRARAIPGVELVTEHAYARTVLHDGATGSVEIAHAERDRSLVATIRFPEVRALPSIVARIRRTFDLAADVTSIGAHLATDPWLAPLVGARPGLRAPGAWDGFELAVRAILGQQVSVAHARSLAAALVRLTARSVSVEPSRASELAFAFPTAADVLAADLGRLGMPDARRKALRSAANAALADPMLFQPLASIEETVERLRAVPGIGDWTAHYIALRAAREPDAFPASDVGLLRGAALPGEKRPSAAELLKRAERWRPFRAYAAEHLWAADASTKKRAS
ncbi:MAG TPA: AlkA N-terminal domain-containing protein [Polyangiaceae bacterium]|nr:AlkA N-terminal domain-containing protein [Polyangiaceae bacterium]